MDLSSYLFGVATLPLLAVGFLCGGRVAYRFVVFADRRGYSAEIRLRAYDPVSDYTLNRDIWWERSFGLVFAGGWYRQEPKYREPEPMLVTRWVGFGRRHGAALMLYRKRHLGYAPAQPQPTLPPLQGVR